MLSAEVKKSIDKCVLCWLATVDASGQPNVAPKEMFCAGSLNDELLIAHIASPQSIANIHQNPRACVSFVDVFAQKGFKLLGMAEVIDKTADSFADIVPPLKAMAGDVFPIQAVIRLRVEKVVPILAPRYVMYPETTEAAQIERAMASYGVQARAQERGTT